MASNKIPSVVLDSCVLIDILQNAEPTSALRGMAPGKRRPGKFFPKIIKYNAETELIFGS